MQHLIHKPYFRVLHVKYSSDNKSKMEYLRMIIVTLINTRVCSGDISEAMFVLSGLPRPTHIQYVQYFIKEGVTDII